MNKLWIVTQKLYNCGLFWTFLFQTIWRSVFSNQDWQIVQHINEFLYPNLQKLHTPMRCDTSSPCVKIVEIIRFALLNTSSTTFMCSMLVHTKEFNLKEIWWFYFVFLTTSWLISSPLFTSSDYIPMKKVFHPVNFKILLIPRKLLSITCGHWNTNRNVWFFFHNLWKFNQIQT